MTAYAHVTRMVNSLLHAIPPPPPPPTPLKLKRSSAVKYNYQFLEKKNIYSLKMLEATITMLAHLHYIECAYKNIQADKEYRWYQTTTIKVWEEKRTKTKRSMNEKKYVKISQKFEGINKTLLLYKFNPEHGQVSDITKL